MIINATHDGAVISGVQHRQMREITVPELHFDIYDEIDTLFKPAVTQPGLDVKTGLMERVNLIQMEIDSLLPILDRAVGFSDNLAMLMRNKSRGQSTSGGQSKIEYLLKKLSEIDRIIESKKHAKDMISFTMQRVFHTITEGYEIDEDDHGLNNDELIAKRSRYLYQGLLEGAQFNRKILKKMTTILTRE